MEKKRQRPSAPSMAIRFDAPWVAVDLSADSPSQNVVVSREIAHAVEKKPSTNKETQLVGQLEPLQLWHLAN